MTSRTSAAAIFVASLVLVVVSLGAWATEREGGVGTDVQQVTTASASSAAGAASDPEASSAPAHGRTPGLGVPLVVASIPRTDATRIETPAPVEPPRRLSIPSVGITMPIEPTGVRRDGQMELPDDPSRIGWYRFGAVPGDDRGSAVLGGHVDSNRYGVGPLVRLADVDRGTRIIVTGADGERLRYRVTSVERITKAALPVQRLFDPDVEPRLVVVTCGGRYLPEAGGYEDNIVVIAEPMD